jgi:hypothetical protein
MLVLVKHHINRAGFDPAGLHLFDDVLRSDPAPHQLSLALVLGHFFWVLV